LFASEPGLEMLKLIAHKDVDYLSCKHWLFDTIKEMRYEQAIEKVEFLSPLSYRRAFLCSNRIASLRWLFY
jgi:hypothetical protein